MVLVLNVLVFFLGLVGECGVLTSALARISHPVAAERDLILKRGVLPMQPSMPSGIATVGITGLSGSSFVWSSSVTLEELGVHAMLLRLRAAERRRLRWRYLRSRSGYTSLKPRVRRTPVMMPTAM